jgi:hypothetical protein
VAQERWRAIYEHGKAGKRGTSGRRASSPQHEVLECLLDSGERRCGERPKNDSNGSGERARVLRVSRAGGGCCLGKKLGHGGRLSRAAGHLGVLEAPRDAERHRTPANSRTRVRVGHGEGKDPDKRDPPVSERTGERGGRGPERGRPGPEEAGPRVGRREGKERAGRAGSWAGKERSWAERGERNGQLGLGRKGEKRRKRKRGSGLGPISKRERKRIVSKYILILI